MATSSPDVLADYNGRVQPLSEVAISALDRGHIFGDGVYEVVRIYGGRAFTMDEHWLRLERSLRELSIAIDSAALRRRAEALIIRAQAAEASLYVQVTRGTAKRTHRFPEPAVPANSLIYVTPLPVDPYEEARRQGVAAVTMPDQRWRRCDIKSLNLLGNCLANDAAHRAGAADAILFDESGRITEGSHTSVFVVDGDMLLTTPSGPWILPGITRQLVLDLAKADGIDVREQWYSREQLRGMREAFFTGTVSEILPIVSLDGVPLSGGEPGPLTRRLMALLKARIAG